MNTWLFIGGDDPLFRHGFSDIDGFNYSRPSKECPSSFKKRYTAKSRISALVLGHEILEWFVCITRSIFGSLDYGDLDE